ncbi:MAG: DUF1489 family protein [Notoacmeibacter sp.]|nr:DUF1489 family protein [Notoacmeibacter sp.]
MALNLVKLSVGTDSVEDLESWIAHRMEHKRRAGEPVEYFHTTRMVPRRRSELLDGGSIYWVIKGIIQCRQRFADIRNVTGEDGIARCQLVLEPELVRTHWAPRRPFQGWRYLKSGDAPGDIGSGAQGAASMPPELRHDLAELGLL